MGSSRSWRLEELDPQLERVEEAPQRRRRHGRRRGALGLGGELGYDARESVGREGKRRRAHGGSDGAAEGLGGAPEGANRRESSGGRRWKMMALGAMESSGKLQLLPRGPAQRGGANGVLSKRRLRLGARAARALLGSNGGRRGRKRSERRERANARNG